MEKIENRQVCLSLNSVWYPIGYKRVRDAICNLYTENFLALDIQYENDNFTNLRSINIFGWKDWVKLPIRSSDFSIGSPRLRIRVPTVIVSKNFSKNPFKEIRFSKKGVFLRDDGVCQYTNKKISKKNLSVDHVVPTSAGGENSWENVVLCDKSVNSEKGSKFLEETDFKLIKNPKPPLMMPASHGIKNVFHLDWSHFLLNKET